MTYIDIDGAQLWYDEFPGEGDPIISCASSFESGGYPEILSRSPIGRPLIQIQARGFGRSSRPDGVPSAGWLDTWADDACAVADRLGIDRFIYTGVSHGGGIGWHIAKRYPQRLIALISVVGTPHDRAGGTESSEGRRRMIANRHDPKVVREQYDILAGWTEDDVRQAGRDKKFQYVLASMSAQDNYEATINQGKPFPEAKTDEELAEVYKSIKVPVLVLGAMRDGVISPQSSLRAVVNVRGAKAVFWEDEGHMIAGESPSRLAREVKLYLDELEGVAEPHDGIVAETYA
jgi:pimeloyl-ACP methyl ester carboxylesterase